MPQQVLFILEYNYSKIYDRCRWVTVHNFVIQRCTIPGGPIVWLNALRALTYLPWKNMADILQTMFSNGFSWLKIFEFRQEFHRNMLWLPVSRQAVTWTSGDRIDWLNSLWPDCAIWWHRTVSTAAQVMAWHYGYVIMGTMASQITSLIIVYSTVYSGADQRKHQSSASLAFVRGIHRGPVNSPHKWPVTQKKFPFDDVIMVSEQAITWANVW